MPVLMDPDCLDGKHRSCSGGGWCEETDQLASCPCSCHRLDVPPSEVYRAAPGTLGEMLGYLPQIPADKLSAHSASLMATRNDPPRADGQHYGGCPCPVCVTIRAAQATTHAIQAKHLSGASIGKLVEYEIGRDIVTSEHQWSPTGTLVNVWHAEDSTEIAIDYDRTQDHADTYDQIGLKPNHWVRVTTQPREV